MEFSADMDLNWNLLRTINNNLEHWEEEAPTEDKQKQIVEARECVARALAIVDGLC